MPGKREQQKARTRERIAAAAMEVYAEQGFSAPTADIARKAHVSHGSIFVHFSTVENLHTHVLEIFSQDIKTELHSLSDNDIETLLGKHIDVLIKNEAFYKRLVTEAAQLPEEAKNTFITIQSTLSIHFLQALESEMTAGRIKAIPLHLLFNTWLGLVHYYLLNSELFAPQGSVLQRHKNTLIECYMALITQQP